MGEMGKIGTTTGQDYYRIRDFVPDFEAIAAETAAQSHRLARNAMIWAGCAYGPGARETMDILLPPRLVAGAPIHMFIHGGYWRSGERAAYTCIAAPVLAVGGIAAIVEYDLMPGTRLAAIVEQLRRATAWLVAQAPGLGADPARLSVSGHSAGAHLASYLAARGKSETTTPQVPLTGLFLLSGIYDLAEIPGSFLKTEAMMTPAEADTWSPLTAYHHAGPHRILALGAEETPPFHDQSAALQRVLVTRGMAAERMVVPGLNHMNVVLDLADPERPLGARLAAMVEASRPARPV